MALTFIERVGDVEQMGGAGFSSESANAVGYYFINQGNSGSILLADIQSAITQILGVTNYDVGTQKLQRTPPLAHPSFPWLFATNISKMWGTGPFTQANSAQGLDVPPLPQFALYSNYFFQVEFRPRPFPVVTDANILLYPGTYYDDTGTMQTFTWANESARFVDFSIMPCTSSDNNLTQTGGNVGTFAWQNSGGSGPANGSTFPGVAQLQLPNQIIKATWYGVPYRLVTSSNSYFYRALNRVNQNQVQFLDFFANPGELLFLGFNPIKYTPPIQQTESFNGVIASQKNCNIELTFLFTRRPGTNIPAALANKSLIYAGHNLLPDFTTRKYYAVQTVPPMGGTPYTPYLSWPMEALFSDCDAAGGVPT